MRLQRPRILEPVAVLFLFIVGLGWVAWLLGRIVERTTQATADSSSQALVAVLQSAFGSISPADSVEQPVNSTPEEMAALRSWVEDLDDPEVDDDWTDDLTVERVFRGQVEELAPIDPTIGAPDFAGEM